jgi:hypothetical protein
VVMKRVAKIQSERDERDDIAHTGPCSICDTVFMGWGHNAAPINDGRCCNDCNGLVIARRIDDMKVNAARSQRRATPGWQPIRQAGCRARFSGGAGGPPRL